MVPTPLELPDPDGGPPTAPRRGFAHQRLDAYRMAVDLVRGVAENVDRITASHVSLRDQVQRSSLSVMRQIAEAASRRSPADRRARFAVARGEAAECDSTLEALDIVGALPHRAVERLRELADRIGAMLTGLIARETRRLEGADDA